VSRCRACDTLLVPEEIKLNKVTRKMEDLCKQCLVVSFTPEGGEIYALDSDEDT